MKFRRTVTFYNSMGGVSQHVFVNDNIEDSFDGFLDNWSDEDLNKVIEIKIVPFTPAEMENE